MSSNSKTQVKFKLIAELLASKQLKCCYCFINCASTRDVIAVSSHTQALMFSFTVEVCKEVFVSMQ